MNNKDKTLIFGYGSLVNINSIHDTVPNATNIRVAYIKGFRREFNKLDEEGWKSNHQELAGIPYCALNIFPHNSKCKVNGTIFSVDSSHLKALQERETGYELVSTTAYDCNTYESLGQCYTFSASGCDGQYDFNNNPAQDRYLQACLDGAKQHGEKFYQEFLSTTYIGDKPLNKLSNFLPKL